MKLLQPKVSPHSKKFTHPAVSVGSMHFFIYENSASTKNDGTVGLRFAEYYRERRDWCEDTYWFSLDNKAQCQLLLNIYKFALKKSFISCLPTFLDNYQKHLDECQEIKG